MKKSKIIKTIAISIVLLAMTVSLFSGCAKNDENRVVIYTSAEDYRIEYMQNRLNEVFPDYDIIIEYMSTGDHAAKLISEGSATEADITYDLEYGYMEQLANAGVLTDLKDMFDMSVWADDALDSTFYLPETRNGGAVIINPAVLKSKGLSAPSTYEDLLKSEYKDLISMPNPKSSGTGYMFLKTLVNTMGEDEAFAYFDKLSENVLQYTSSGSGPVNALIQGEIAIGLGMTAQAVKAINDGHDLQIIYFEEGSPYSMYGQGIIAGKESKTAVKEVFEFLINTYSYENCEKFFPEQIFKDKTYEIENYPTNIKYSDMSNNTLDEKARLLEKWKY